MLEIVLSWLVIAVTITLPILVALEKVRSLLGKILQSQEETNRLLRRYLTGEHSDTG